MRFAICIPTAGNSSWRLEKEIASIREFTKGIDYEILVRDDGTPNKEYVAMQQEVCSRLGVFHEAGPEWNWIAGNFDKLGWLAKKRGADVIVYAADDLLMSRGWLDSIRYYYENNKELNNGIVSGVMIECWELAMNGVIAGEDSMYEWDNKGDVMREHLKYDESLYIAAKDAGKIHLANYCKVIGVGDDFSYTFNKPTPLDGGLGPCFSIRTDVFEKVNGFANCEFAGDFECMIGHKVWKIGYKCVMIPSPPVYHARGVTSNEIFNNTLPKSLTDKYRPWNEVSEARYKERWQMPSFRQMQEHIIKTYCRTNDDVIRESKFIPYWPPLKNFPITQEYITDE